MILWFCSFCIICIVCTAPGHGGSPRLQQEAFIASRFNVIQSSQIVQ